MIRAALIHIPTAEISFLRNVFEVMATRGLAYEIATTPEQIAAAELAFIDADNALAIQHWNSLRLERPDITGILVSKRAPPDAEQLWVQRPFNSLKLFTALGKADLKRHPQRPAVRTERRTAPAIERRSLQGLRVLVVDDSAPVRKQLELILGEQGVHVHCADNGELGLHLLTTQHFDLIFLDVVLPGADGYQICKTIKKNKQKQRVPVVMLTSKSSPFDRVKGSLSGCDSYLTKPVDAKKLVDVLHKHSERRATTDTPPNVALAGSSL